MAWFIAGTRSHPRLRLLRPADSLVDARRRPAHLVPQRDRGLAPLPTRPRGRVSCDRSSTFRRFVAPVSRTASSPSTGASSPTCRRPEKEAIDAGTVWWDADLFSGKPDWDKLLKTPEPRLSPEEQAFLDGPVEELCAMCDEWEISHEHQDLPPHARGSSSRTRASSE